MTNDPFLTIGMATYRDYDGVLFTVEALRLYQDLSGVELLVVDNYGCEDTRRGLTDWDSGVRYVRATEKSGTAYPRQKVFEEARGRWVLCVDCHVLFESDAIARLKEWCYKYNDCRDLLQGPMLYNDLKTVSTHFDPTVWSSGMWGQFRTDERGVNPHAEPFEIPMMGLGAFACRRDAWLGFNQRFRGFGAEEGYIHEKFRQAGHRTLCLPFLRWWHRFGRPGGIPYACLAEDQAWNYLVGHHELGLDPAPVLKHFANRVPAARLVQLLSVVKSGLDKPRDLTVDPILSHLPDGGSTSATTPPPPRSQHDGAWLSFECDIQGNQLHSRLQTHQFPVSEHHKVVNELAINLQMAAEKR